VESIPGYVHGQRVEISDRFRLGRFCSGKNRPVLVKLHAVRDRRIILNNCRVLKNYSKRGIFITGDQQTMDRLKYRAERANKIVDVSNGVLSIDGVVVFSLKDLSYCFQWLMYYHWATIALFR